MAPVSAAWKITGAQKKGHGRRARGFTLIEVTMAMLILTFGVLALGVVLTTSLSFMNMSQDEFICQQKAAEAVESIYAARNTQVLTWAQIDNIGAGGIFDDGPQPLLDPGVDGLVNTADDKTNLPDGIIAPGADGILGSADDITIPLQNFTRTVAFQDNLFGNVNLKQITVTVTFRSGSLTRTYTLISYISAFS